MGFLHYFCSTAAVAPYFQLQLVPVIHIKGIYFDARRQFMTELSIFALEYYTTNVNLSF
jgi:hypothetical protein